MIRLDFKPKELYVSFAQPVDEWQMNFKVDRLSGEIYMPGLH